MKTQIGHEHCRSQEDTRVHPLGPNTFTFMQFSAKILPNDRFAPNSGVGVYYLGNPGPSTYEVN